MSLELVSAFSRRDSQSISRFHGERRTTRYGRPALGASRLGDRSSQFDGPVSFQSDNY